MKKVELCLCSLLVMGAAVTIVKAQSTDGDKIFPGSSVNVLIDVGTGLGQFTEDQKGKIIEALNAWEGFVSGEFDITFKDPVFSYDGSATTANPWMVFINGAPSGAETACGKTTHLQSSSIVAVANVYINIKGKGMELDAVGQTAGHEIGHSFGFGATHGGSGSVMSASLPDGSCRTQSGLLGPSLSDQAKLRTVDAYEIYLEQKGGSEDEDANGCVDGEEFVSDDNFGGSGAPGCGSPILIGEDGNRIRLTSLQEGVFFDLDADGKLERVAWTRHGNEASFLALDRNGNGWIDDGSELFGNFTPQPESSAPNGFLALGSFDAPAAGGNGDGFLSTADSVFAELVLWTDLNHDGISQWEEIHPLSESGVQSISLDFRESRRRDRHGNLFRYWSFVHMEGARLGTGRKHAVDVFFVMEVMED